MKIYDISQELFSCVVFPIDIPPERLVQKSIESGSLYNLTALKMSAHSGTHVDAPYHFYKDGKTIDQIDLNKFIGKCYVTFADGEVSGELAEQIIEKARSIDKEAAKRILIGGKACVTFDAAQVFVQEKIDLVGNESQTIGPEDRPAKVHFELLKAEVVLLEGIRLTGIPEGVYFLNAAPINLGGSDGAPCRAILIGE